MKAHARLLLLVALLLAPIVSGCTITQPCPVDVQPPLTQAQVDEAVELAKKEAVKDLTQHYVWFGNTEITPEDVARAKDKMSELTFFEVDYSVEGQSVIVYMVWTNGWWVGGEGNPRTVRRDKADTNLYTVRRFHSGWRFTEKTLYEVAKGKGEGSDLNPFID